MWNQGIGHIQQNDSFETASVILWNSVESDLGCTSRIYFENETLTLQIPCKYNNKTNAIAEKQTVINGVYVFFFNKIFY